MADSFEKLRLARDLGPPVGTIYKAMLLRAHMPDVTESGRAPVGPITDAALSFLISVGIVSFGFWAAATAASPICMILALLAVLVGLLSLSDAIQVARS